MTPRVRTFLGLALVTALFAVLVTANGAGYRYGISDQSFYIPAIDLAATPSLFPRDRGLLLPQAQLTVLDEAIAGVRSASGLSLETIFFAGYLVTAALFASGVALVGRGIYASRWTTAALLMALTLRHRIARTGVNTYESYFHPRVLTFAIGLIAVGLFLRGRRTTAAVVALAACLVHPTTGAWFAIWMAAAWAATAWASPPGRRIVTSVAVGGLLGAGVLVASGALASRVAVMDGPWLAAFESRDYLFPATDWKVGTWLTHLLPMALIAGLWSWRRRLTLPTGHENAIVAGCMALPLVFLVSLPFVESHVALAVQLQTSRVFWQLDLLATVYLIWALVEAPWTAIGAVRRGVAVTTAVAIASLARGYYILQVEHDHRLIAVSLPASDWQRMGRWIETNTAPDAHVLADPDHVWSYGSSLRVSADRDVAIEAVKDAAIAIYSREGALRVADRRRAIGNFHALTEARAKALADSYDFDYLLTEQSLQLPVAHAEGKLKLYRLEPAS